MSKITLTNMVMIQDLKTGKILVQDRVKIYCGIAFPGGHTENGESIYDSAIREIKEETGYNICDLHSCGFIYWDEENSDKYFTFFYKTSNYSGQIIEETEEGKVFWIQPDELPHMKLAPNMDKYLKIFSGKYSECYCSLQDGKWNVVYR